MGAENKRAKSIRKGKPGSPRSVAARNGAGPARPAGGKDFPSWAGIGVDLLCDGLIGVRKDFAERVRENLVRVGPNAFRLDGEWEIDNVAVILRVPDAVAVAKALVSSRPWTLGNLPHVVSAALDVAAKVARNRRAFDLAPVEISDVEREYPPGRRDMELKMTLSASPKLTLDDVVPGISEAASIISKLSGDMFSTSGSVRTRVVGKDEVVVAFTTAEPLFILALGMDSGIPPAKEG